MATERLASWAVYLQYSDLPSSVIDGAVRSFYNWAGCAIGGSNHRTTTTARNALSQFFGRPTSRILGSDESVRADASHAALINGIASHVHDYDDTHLETIIHPTGPVASALLAQADAVGPERPVTGEQFILALVVGIEAECKVGLAVWPKHYDLGWHITSTTGSIGAAVAVGKLIGLTATQMAHAIGIAATQVTGLREMFGSDTKSFHVGRAAQNGLMAAILAEHGYTSSTRALEAKRGWARVVVGGEADDQEENDDSTTTKLDHQINTLGQTWEISKNAFKPFPCGIVVHPIIDGCIQIHHELDFSSNVDTNSIENIKTVRCRVHPLVLELTGKQTPQDGLQAKFSVYHGAAVGLVFGKAGPSQYEDEVVTSEKVVRVRNKIDAVVDESLNADEAEIVVEFEGDGGQTSTVKQRVVHAVGSLEMPMTDRQLEDKFIDQVSPVVGEDGARRLSERFWGLKEAKTTGVDF
ncbi:hypothetical protein ABEF93_000011 [Exophiala dermatitidis]